MFTLYLAQVTSSETFKNIFENTSNFEEHLQTADPVKC